MLLSKLKTEVKWIEETEATEALGALADHGRCMMQCAAIVEYRRKFLSSRLKENLFIAGNAIRNTGRKDSNRIFLLEYDAIISHLYLFLFC